MSSTIVLFSTVLVFQKIRCCRSWHFWFHAVSYSCGLCVHMLVYFRWYVVILIQRERSYYSTVCSHYPSSSPPFSFIHVRYASTVARVSYPRCNYSTTSSRGRYSNRSWSCISVRVLLFFCFDSGFCCGESFHRFAFLFLFYRCPSLFSVVDVRYVS